MTRADSVACVRMGTPLRISGAARECIVETVPITAVGKICKPILRQDAVERVVRGILDERGLQGDVEVTAGGPRGMGVRVTLSDAGDDASSQLQQVLDGYLFGATVET
jgi:fatty-acyl-CoA synthase